MSSQCLDWVFYFCLFNTKIAFCSLLQQSLLLLLLTDNLIVFCCCCLSRVCLQTEKSIWFLITANLRQTNCGLCQIRRINEKKKQKQTLNKNNNKAVIWVTNPYNGTRAADAAAGRKCSKATDAKGDNNNNKSYDCEFKCRLAHWTVIFWILYLNVRAREIAIEIHLHTIHFRLLNLSNWRPPFCYIFFFISFVILRLPFSLQLFSCCSCCYFEMQLGKSFASGARR